MAIHPFDYVTLAVYMILMIVIGAFYARRVKKVNDFYAGEGRVPWPLASLSLFMTSFSAFIFVAYGGISYKEGIVAITLCMTTPIAFVVGAHFFATRWKRARIVTPVEFLETRYNFTVRQFVPVATIPLALIDNAMKVFAMATFFKIGFDLNIYWSIAGCGLIVGAYSFMGGLWAVTVTDVVQCLVLSAAVLVVLPLSISEVGGLSVFIQKSSDLGMLEPLGEKSFGYVMTFLLLILLAYNYKWSLIQRYYCVPDERAAKKVGYLCAGLFLIAAFMWTVPAMAARHILPGLENPDYAYAALCVKILPVGMMGIVLSAMFAATMSSVSSEYNILSGVFTVDIYKRWIKKAATEAQTMWVARASTLLICIIVTCIAFFIASQGKGLFGIMTAVFSLLLPPIAVPVLWGILFPKPYGRSALMAMVIGLVCGAWVKFVYLPAHPDAPALAWTLLGGFIPSVLVMCSGLLWDKPSDDSVQRVGTFFNQLAEPIVVPEVSVDKSNSPFFMVGICSLCIGALQLVATFFTETMLHAGINAGVGLALGILGFLLVKRSRAKTA